MFWYKLRPLDNIKISYEVKVKLSKRFHSFSTRWPKLLDAEVTIHT